MTLIDFRKVLYIIMGVRSPEYMKLIAHIIRTLLTGVIQHLNGVCFSLFSSQGVSTSTQFITFESAKWWF